MNKLDIIINKLKTLGFEAHNHTSKGKLTYFVSANNDITVADWNGSQITSGKISLRSAGAKFVVSIEKFLSFKGDASDFVLMFKHSNFETLGIELNI